LEILHAYPDSISRRYFIDPDGEGGAEAFSVSCDMERDGGGWTGISRCIAEEHFQPLLVAEESAPIETLRLCTPSTQDANSAHSYHYSFSFPAGFQEFYFSGYLARARAADNAKSEIDPARFQQGLWSLGHGDQHGDISFGAAEQLGPLTSYARTLQAKIECEDCHLDWPEPEQNYDLGEESHRFRIGWGEEGGQAEGWFPWFGGSIFLR